VRRGQGHRIWAPRGNPGDERRAYRHQAPPRQLPTRLRYGNSARVLGQIRNYALQRLAIWLSKKGNRRRAWRWGLKQLLLSPNQMGLISLDGTVVAPRPFRDWRGKQGTERRR
jgi:hypothetical protein